MEKDDQRNFVLALVLCFGLFIGYNMLVLAQWMYRQQNSACTARARDSYASLLPFMGEGRYVNYFGDDEPSDAIAAAYGPNYRRLQEVKATYDPANFFRMNQNIQPP